MGNITFLFLLNSAEDLTPKHHKSSVMYGVQCAVKSIYRSIMEEPNSFYTRGRTTLQQLIQNGIVKYRQDKCEDSNVDIVDIDINGMKESIYM